MRKVLMAPITRRPRRTIVMLNRSLMAGTCLAALLMGAPAGAVDWLPQHPPAPPEMWVKVGTNSVAPPRGNALAWFLKSVPPGQCVSTRELERQNPRLLPGEAADIKRTQRADQGTGLTVIQRDLVSPDGRFNYTTLSTPEIIVAWFAKQADCQATVVTRELPPPPPPPPPPIWYVKSSKADECVPVAEAARRASLPDFSPNTVQADDKTHGWRVIRSEHSDKIPAAAGDSPVYHTVTLTTEFSTLTWFDNPTACLFTKVAQEPMPPLTDQERAQFDNYSAYLTSPSTATRLLYCAGLMIHTIDYMDSIKQSTWPAAASDETTEQYAASPKWQAWEKRWGPDYYLMRLEKEALNSSEIPLKKYFYTKEGLVASSITPPQGDISTPNDDDPLYPVYIAGTAKVRGLTHLAGENITPLLQENEKCLHVVEAAAAQAGLSVVAEAIQKGVQKVPPTEPPKTSYSIALENRAIAAEQNASDKVKYNFIMSRIKDLKSEITLSLQVNRTADSLSGMDTVTECFGKPADMYQEQLTEANRFVARGDVNAYTTAVGYARNALDGLVIVNQVCRGTALRNCHDEALEHPNSPLLGVCKLLK